MNLLEQQLDYPLGDTLPALGTAMPILPGVKWIRMGLPFALDHINLWLLRDELDGRAGWTVVDCCISRAESKSQWEQIFATQLEGLPILRVIVTHMHPDHIGLAAWLCARWTTSTHTCRLWISATDYNAARLASASVGGFGGEASAMFFASHGLTDAAALAQIRDRVGYYAGMVPDVPRSFCRLMDGQVVRIGGRSWHCISGYGHSPEHIALYCDDAFDDAFSGADGVLPAAGSPVLIGGDMMLPRISTNVSVYDIEPESDPLAQFLSSIDKFRTLDGNTLTLPSHGKPFRGLHTRVQQLQDHHRDRLAEVMQACEAQACAGTDILPVMFKRPLDLHQTTFALGEAVAHLHQLWFAGKLRRELQADGVYRFMPA